MRFALAAEPNCTHLYSEEESMSSFASSTYLASSSARVSDFETPIRVDPSPGADASGGLPPSAGTLAVAAFIRCPVQTP
ncbi:unnamed protein product [Linum trigynum]|uniref:Uncharacterized protein n=1 Tax=Linum trigynum TaxID=586398 RepID=A0AAV2GRS7_9ROSI